MKPVYFAMYPTDFLAGVGHLGNTELGIYWRLLLVYYRDQRPLPGDLDKLRRIAMTFSPEECRALEEVVLEFFVPGVDDAGRRVYRHARADKEIERARHAHARKSEGAAKARAKKTNPEGLTRPLISTLTSTLTSTRPSALIPTGESESESEPERETSSLSRAPDGADRDPAVSLAIEAKKAGVQCHGSHPVIRQLAAQGVAPETLRLACEEAKSKLAGKPPPIGYVAKVLETWAQAAAGLNAAGARAPAQQADDEIAKFVARVKAREAANAGL
jgi:uncharacterized protein YdaU (DUF1376 family)